MLTACLIASGFAVVLASGAFWLATRSAPGNLLVSVKHLQEHTEAMTAQLDATVAEWRRYRVEGDQLLDAITKAQEQNQAAAKKASNYLARRAQLEGNQAGQGGDGSSESFFAELRNRGVPI